MKRKGISLVALVVTIIVMIILTGAVIATFMEDGIIERSNEAVKGNDYKTLVEAYEIKESEAQIDYEIDGIEYDKIKVLKETVEDLSLKGFEFDLEEDDKDKRVMYKGENEKIAKWVIETFKYQEIQKGGYLVSEVDGKAYITGIKVSGLEVITTVKEILNILPNGYTMKKSFYGKELEDVTLEEKVTTGYKILKPDGTEYATIVVKGDFDPDYIIGDTDGALISAVTMGGSKGSIEQFLACDINNDGIVSLDDGNIAIGSTIMDYYEEQSLQNITMIKMPTIINEEIYTWYTKSKILELLTKGENGYKIVDKTLLYNITLPAETTYKQLEDGIKEKLGIEKNSNKLYLNIENKEMQVVEGTVVLTIPGIIKEGVYSEVSSMRFKIIIE